METIDDPFLKKSLMLAVDGNEPEELRDMMELELENQSERDEKISQVFQSAGGFCPTIGIIGAFIGLVQDAATPGRHRLGRPWDCGRVRGDQL